MGTQHSEADAVCRGVREETGSERYADAGG